MPGKFEIKESAGGKFRFNLKAGNGQIILSSESYESKQGAETCFPAHRHKLCFGLGRYVTGLDQDEADFLLIELHWTA